MLHGKSYGHGHQGHGARGHHERPSRPAMQSKVVSTKEVNLPGKKFVLRGISNQRGEAIEIREYANGKDNIVVIPREGFGEVLTALSSIEEALTNETRA